MYKSKHTKSKSDTDFHNNKIINDDICGSLKIFQTDLFKKLKDTKNNENKSKGNERKLSIFKKNEEKCLFIVTFEKILLLKKEFDNFFFRTKLPSIKFDLDNILKIINKNIDELKIKLIKECPILEKSVLIDKLNIFSDVIQSLIETKPQEFYKEIKFVILSHFEKIRLEIFELLENLNENENEEENSIQDINKIKSECKFKHGILFNVIENGDNIDNKNNNFNLTSEIKNIISVILPRKNEILQFIEGITHEILFSLTNFSYIIDYYSLSISFLNLQLFKSIISYIEKYKNIINTARIKQNKVLLLIELIFILNKTFIKKSLGDMKKKINNSESSIQNSMGKFILNNLNELIPKCEGLNNIKNKTLNTKSAKSLFTKTYEKLLFYKNYMKTYKETTKVQLVKSFKFYYDLKLIFWKSVYTKIDQSVKSPNICCRICEQVIPLNDFVLHVYYCKEQNNYYKKMNSCKMKIKKFINSLEIYRTKINQKIFKGNNFFKKNLELNKILKKIKKEEKLINIDKNNSDFLQVLIKIYINENNKPNDYYEKNPDKLINITTLIYLTYFVFIMNKKQTLNNSDLEDDELSDILGNFLNYFIQILINTEYLLEARQTRTKSNRYLNNIHYSFNSNSSDEDSVISSSKSRVCFSSKNVVFNEFNINNTNNTNNNNNQNGVSNERGKRRNSVRHQSISMMMEDIKTKFSFNKSVLNQSQRSQNNTSQIFNTTNNNNNNNISQETSSISILSSTSNVGIMEFQKKSRELKSTKALNEINDFFEMRSYSENKNEEVFNFLNPKKKKESANKKGHKTSSLENKQKIVNNFKSPKSQRTNHKSSRFLLYNSKPKEEPIKIENKNKINNIFQFESKDLSFDGDNNNHNNFFENSLSKEFFSPDKKIRNTDSSSDSDTNSENEKDKDLDILTNNKHFSSAKINSVMSITQEKKIPSIFLKSDKNLNYKPTLNYRDGKKSLFHFQHDENNQNAKRNQKNIVKHPSSSKLNLEGDNKMPSEDFELENHDNFQKFEKVKVNDKKRGKSPDINKKKRKRKSIYDYKNNKNLVLVDDYESSDNISVDDESIEENDEKNIKEKEKNINENDNEKNIKKIYKKENFILNLRTNNKQNLNSSDSSDDNYESEKLIKAFNNGTIKNDKDDSQNNSFCHETDEYQQIFENTEEEQNWFNFDNNFFMNSNINSQNIHIINIIKEILCEINDGYENDEENNNIKEEEDDNCNNEEKEIDNLKFTINNSSKKSSESNMKMSNFKLILPLAKGGYGTVGLYKKTSTGDMFAIKSVDINNMKEKKLSQTLQNERNILKGISSDYVVNSYYIFKDKINYYFVMEYLPGGDVYNLLSSIILPFSTIQLIIAETLLAVYYLHSINIIHHDIKPENILITKDGHFKLSDFGLSKTVNENIIKENDEEDSSNNNKSSSISSNSSNNNSEHDDNKTEGTLYYMAPELFTNDYPVGKPIDYWAIGIVIYELFTFKVPFEAETQEQTRKNIIDYNVNWEPIYSEEVSKNYKNYIDCTIDLIKKFIFFNPQQRWGDKNFKDIQNHEFFKGFDWVNIKKIKSTAVLSHLKKVVEKNNKKIKELNKEKGEKNNGDLICEVDLAYDESNVKFSQRIDNLQKRNNELIKMKFKKKEIKIEDDDKNYKRSLLFDLQ